MSVAERSKVERCEIAFVKMKGAQFDIQDPKSEHVTSRDQTIHSKIILKFSAVLRPYEPLRSKIASGADRRRFGLRLLLRLFDKRTATAVGCLCYESIYRHKFQSMWPAHFSSLGFGRIVSELTDGVLNWLLSTRERNWMPNKGWSIAAQCR